MYFKVTTPGPISLSHCSQFFTGLSLVYRGLALGLDEQYAEDFLQMRSAMGADVPRYLIAVGRQSEQGRYEPLQETFNVPTPSVLAWLPPMRREPLIRELRIGSLEGIIADIFKHIFHPFRRTLTRANDVLGRDISRGPELPREAIGILRESSSRSRDFRGREFTVEIGAGLIGIGAVDLEIALRSMHATRLDTDQTSDDLSEEG